jgi:hypothetical protein
MLEAVLSSPLLKRTGELIEKRLGRPLEPFDVWYNGFRPRGTYSAAELDAITKKRYPTAKAYEEDMPNLLVGLGFEEARAAELASNILVEPARGSGHAWGASMRDAKSHLRTRVGSDGMDYKGFNIAVHEMGHNVEQTISLNDIDHYLLNGVPNTAFTEALAFVFQKRDLQLLGLAPPNEEDQALQVLNDYWGTAEIAAVGLVDIKVWHWMYDNPEATPAELKAATLNIARNVWNRYYAPVFGIAHDSLLPVSARLLDRSYDCAPDRGAGRAVPRPRRRIRAHVPGWTDHAGSVDEECHGQAGWTGRTAARGGKVVGRDRGELAPECAPTADENGLLERRLFPSQRSRSGV